MTTNRDATLQGLIQHEWPKLRRFFRTKVADGDVLDLVQNTMLAYVEGHPEPGCERQYLWGIARKQVLKHYAKFRGENEPFDSTVHRATDVGPTLSSRLDRRNQVVNALLTLPADQQMAIELRYCEGLQLEEVAASLDVSLATVKRYLSAAEERLRVQIGGVHAIADGYRKL
jgi:RNA polymerase sigma factor (sigma-70 family)